MQHIGRTYIYVDGEQVKSMDGAKLKLGGVSRTPVVGNRVHGYAENAEPAELTCTISVGKGDSVAKWNQVTNATLVFEADTGHTWTIGHAFVTNTQEVTGGEGGQVELTFVGEEAEEDV